MYVFVCGGDVCRYVFVRQFVHVRMCVGVGGLCVCVCVCANVSVYVCMYVCVSGCVCVSVCAKINKNSHLFSQYILLLNYT